MSILKRPYRFLIHLYHRGKFAAFGNHSWIQSPLRIDGGKNIKIGACVAIQYKTWLGALPLTGAEKAELLIEDGTVIGNFNHIFATKRIVIERNVLTADKVFISDNLHCYEDPLTPIVKQQVVQNGEVVIGEGSWIGENACVLGARIGKHCVVGANSVVTKDVPDYCVVVGAPAIIIKRFDFKEMCWVKVSTDDQL